MVSGRYYGIQYEINLIREIDYFDELLPIWIDVRAKIEIEKNRQTGECKLIVIPYGEFQNQLLNNELFESFVRENSTYNSLGIDKKLDEEYLRSNKFVMALLYEKLIKYNTELPEPITKEEFEEICKESSELNKTLWSFNNFSEQERSEQNIRYNELSCQIKFQRFLHDQEYFDEIKSLNRQLLDQVVLSEEQNKRVQKVLNHPKLEGLISWHGLKLANGSW